MDEYAVALGAKLPALESRAIELLAPPKPGIEPPVAPTPGTLREGQHTDLDAAGLRAAVRKLEDLLEEHPGSRLTIHWKLHRGDRE